MNQQIPDLKNPTVARKALLLGFSYSLDPDGAPGSYNRLIANSILNHIPSSPYPADYPTLALQWEIADALGSSYPGSPPIVVPPPRFEPEDFPDPDPTDSFIRILKKGETAAARRLADATRTLLTGVGYLDPNDPNRAFELAALNKFRLPIYLNQLLTDSTYATFYASFRNTLELHDLLRPDLGAVGVERRELPAGDAPLLPFQTQRVNRLIIEAICPDEKILRRGKYLNTQGVLDRVLSALESKRHDIEHVFVFGHPAHSGRCRRQTIESLWKAGWSVPLDHIYDVHLGQQWPWDPATAQVWCRNQENWKDYENMGVRRL